MDDFDKLSRQRMDFSTGPNGETIATLTITLGDGSVHRYEASTDEEEIDKLASAIAAAEIQAMAVEGIVLSEEEIAGAWDDFVGGVKKVGNVAKKVAASKAFKMAGEGLTMAAPALGPYAPIAMTVGGGMGIAHNVANQAIAYEAGAKKAAKLLGLRTKRNAKIKGGGGWFSLAKIGGRKTKAAFKLASKKKKTKRRKRGKTKGTKPNVLALARAGKLRSNRKGGVTASDLKRAAKQGRVYWLAA